MIFRIGGPALTRISDGRRENLESKPYLSDMPVQEGIPVTRGPLCNGNGVEDSMSSEPARYLVAAFSTLADLCPALHLPPLVEALEAIREKTLV